MTKVLIVDDASVFRITLSNQLKKEENLEVVGAAKNGQEALEMVIKFSPDILILDLEMPVMDGLQTLEELKKMRPKPRCKVIMFSSHTVHGAENTLKALHLGAVDFVTKPSKGSLSEGQKEIKRTLIPLIHALGTGPAKPLTKPTTTLRPKIATRSSRGFRKDVVGLGVSTGGPESLLKVIPKLDADMRCPVLMVQHMPPIFTGQLAERLNAQSAINVKEAQDGDVLKPGWVYIAPGGYHMVVEPEDGKNMIRLNQEPPANSCRPSVDVLFDSLAKHFGNRTLGIIMTGIGQDGMKGCEALKKNGASVISQNQETCVVYGMPRFVNEAGLSDEIVPLEDIADKAKYYLL